MVFGVRNDFTTSIHDEMRDWVARNIDRWKGNKPDWFKIEMILDAFLPSDVFEAVGGARRRRSSVSIREIVGISPAEPTNDENKHEIICLPNSLNFDYLFMEWISKRRMENYCKCCHFRFWHLPSMKWFDMIFEYITPLHDLPICLRRI